MASSADMRYSPRQGLGTASALRERVALVPGTRAGLVDPAVGQFKERRRRRRVSLEPMYTWASVRVLGQRGAALEAHVLDLSETGMAVQVDEQLAPGQAVAVEFSIPGLGVGRSEHLPAYAVAAQVVRIDDLDDFPGGPYRTALRFVRISTMVQAKIARFVAMPGMRVS